LKNGRVKPQKQKAKTQTWFSSYRTEEWNKPMNEQKRDRQWRKTPKLHKSE